MKKEIKINQEGYVNSFKFKDIININEVEINSSEIIVKIKLNSKLYYDDLVLITLHQKNSEIDFTKIIKVNFVDVSNGLITIEVELKK